MANDLVLKTAHNQLEKLLVSKAGALPKDFNQTRFLQNCMTVLQDTKGIEKVQPITIARTMLKGAFLGGLLGSALVMLLTPYSGDELKARVKDYVDNVQDEVSQAGVEKRLELETQLELMRSGKI